MRAWVAAALALGFSFFLSPRAWAYDLPELAARTRPSVVHLTVLDAGGKPLGSGTGFFVSADGRILTNFHVVAGSAGATATDAEGRAIKVLGAIAWDQENDLALLQAEAGAYPPLTLAAGVPRPGDEVFVIGSPKGLEGTLSSGIVAAIREKGITGGPDKNDRGLTTAGWGIQITAAISPGSSGSPVLDTHGEVIGVAVGIRLDGQALNFAIPVAKAHDLLATVGEGARPRPLSDISKTDRVLWRNIAISAGFFGGVIAIWLVVTRIARRPKKKKPEPRAVH
jgi:S1-C subfamily serine protease